MNFSLQPRVPSIAITLLLTSVGLGWGQAPDQITKENLANAKPIFHSPVTRAATIKSSLNTFSFTRGVRGIDSIPNFDGSFTTAGFDSQGNPNLNWFYNMAGKAPVARGTTIIDAPVVPVSVLLLNADGTPRSVNGQLLYSDANQYVNNVLESPIYRRTKFDSSPVPTQYTDAIQRAEFWNDVNHTFSRDGWHTLMRPGLKQSRVMLIPQGSYQFALHDDGSCCEFILVDVNTLGNLLFPSGFPINGSTVIGAAELAGDMTTKDITTFLFPNVFLYIGDPSNCCILGFHSFDFEPGTLANGNNERRYIMNFSSWITPGLFGPAFEDITALSHELAETFDDPFVASDGVLNITPWWLSPNGNCQNNLENGDVVEGLTKATFPIRLNGFTYHPQNVALLQWFEFKQNSDAIHGAYSYPDTSVLTDLSPMEKPGCK